MAIITRDSKGSELTHGELDNNFTELEQRIAEKANTSHAHSIANITGLQDELNGKIDEGAVNVANGLLRLNSSAKVPCEYLTDCFDAGGKVTSSYLFAENGKVKPELLPSGECDCEQITTDILALQTGKANRNISWRITSDSILVLESDDIIIIDNTATVGLVGLPVGFSIKFRRSSDSIAVTFDADVRFSDGTNGLEWQTLNGKNTMELLYTTGHWYQIG